MPDDKIPDVPFNPLTPDMMRLAQEELQEKPEWRERDIQALRDMLEADTELVAPKDDAFLLRFLRARKFDYDLAYQLLQRYYLIRFNNADLYADFRPSSVMNVFQDNVQVMLPEYDQCGRKVFIFRAGKWNPETSSLDDVFRANQMCLESAIEEEATQINGIVAIVDMKDIGVNQAKYLRPAYAKKVISLIQDCFPARFKGFHFVNEPAVFDMVLMMIKAFLNDKIKERIFCHGWDMEALHKHICPEILPKEYGGHLPPMDNTTFVKSLVNRDDEFLQSTKFGYRSKQEVKRIDAIDGIVGNYYRKLCID